MPETTETTVPIRRVTVSTERPFDDVVAAVYPGLGRVPDFRGLVERWSTARDAEEFEAIVGAVSGSSGLIEFLRIIAGNPVTMSKMAATVIDAGSYAPITILIAERTEGTTLSYDRIASAIAPYASQEASAVATALDDAVVTLLQAAAR
jgi:hypothetical protein